MWIIPCNSCLWIQLSRMLRPTRGMVQNACHSGDSSGPLDGSGVLQRLLPAAERRNFIAWRREPQGRCRRERTTILLTRTPNGGDSSTRAGPGVDCDQAPLGTPEISGWGGFDCSCSRASFHEIHQYHAHRRRALFLEAKVAVGKNKATKASKATKAIDTS